MTGLLLVEDRPDNREAYAMLFRRLGLDVYEAEGLDSALSLFKRVASKVSGIVTDVRLDESEADNRDGEVLVSKIRKHNATLPVIGISAYDLETKLVGSFSAFYQKSSTNPDRDFISNIPAIRKLAEDYEASRYADAPRRLLKFKEKYSISDADFNYLISTIPLSQKLNETLLPIHDFVSPSSLEDSKFSRLHIVDPATEEYSAFSLRKTLPIVVTETNEGIFITEVFSLPTIFAYGAGEGEAITALLESLTEYARELESTEGENLDIVKFGAFLRSLFDG